MDLLLIFVSGLTLGGLTCSLIQIGLFSSLFAQGAHSQAKLYSSISIYLLTRIVGAILIGLLLGFLGRSAILSGQVLYTVQLIAGLVMILTALSFLPTKHFLRLPSFGGWGSFSKLVERVFGLKHQWLVVPLFFGLVSFFIPCGATLAIEAQALSSGSPFYAALSLTVFVIGTIPAFLGMSILGKFLSMQLRRSFYLFTGIFLIILGVVTINGVLVLVDAPITLQKIGSLSPFYLDDGDSHLLSGDIEDGVRVIEIAINDDGYTPQTLWVGEGEPVKLSLKTTNVYNCASVFRIPALGISKQLPSNGTEYVAFTPADPGDLYFSCSTGIKTGVIHVVS